MTSTWVIATRSSRTRTKFAGAACDAAVGVPGEVCTPEVCAAGVCATEVGAEAQLSVRRAKLSRNATRMGLPPCSVSFPLGSPTPLSGPRSPLCLADLAAAKSPGLETLFGGLGGGELIALELLTKRELVDFSHRAKRDFLDQDHIVGRPPLRDAPF